MTDPQRTPALDLEGLPPLLLGYALSWVPGLPPGFLAAARTLGLGQVGDLRTPPGRDLLLGFGIGDAELQRALRALTTWRTQVTGRDAPAGLETLFPDPDPPREDYPSARLGALFNLPGGGIRRPDGVAPERGRGVGGAQPRSEAATAPAEDGPRRRLVRPVPESKPGDGVPAGVDPTPRAAGGVVAAGSRARRGRHRPAAADGTRLEPGPGRAPRGVGTPRPDAPPPPHDETPWSVTLGLAEIPRALQSASIERLGLPWRVARAAARLGCRTLGDVLASTPSAWRDQPQFGRSAHAELQQALERLAREGLRLEQAHESIQRSSDLAALLTAHVGEARFAALERRLALPRWTEPGSLAAIARDLGVHPEQVRQHELRAVAALVDSGLAERVQQVLLQLFSRLALRRQGLVPLSELEDDRFFDRWTPAGCLRLLERLGGSAPRVVDGKELVARDGRFLVGPEVRSLEERVTGWGRKTAERGCEPLDEALGRLLRTPSGRGLSEDLAEWILQRVPDLVEVHGGVPFLGQRYRVVLHEAEALMRRSGRPATVQEVRKAVETVLHPVAWPSFNLVHTTLLRYPQFRRVAPATFEWVDPREAEAAEVPGWVDAAVRVVEGAGVPLRAVDIHERLRGSGELPADVTEQVLASVLRRCADRVRFLPRGQIVPAAGGGDADPALLQDLVYDVLVERGPMTQAEVEAAIRPLRAFSSVSVHGVLRLEPWVFRLDAQRHDLVDRVLGPAALKAWMARFRARAAALGRPYHRDDVVDDVAAGRLPQLPARVGPDGMFDILRRQQGFAVGGHFLTTDDLPERMRAEPIVGSILWVLDQAEGPLSTRQISDRLGGRLSPRDVHRGLQRAPEAVRVGEALYGLAEPPRWDDAPGRTRRASPAG